MDHNVAPNSQYDEYPELLEAVQNRFDFMITNGMKLFTTNADGLYEAYLEHLPADARQGIPLLFLQKIYGQIWRVSYHH